MKIATKTLPNQFKVIYAKDSSNPLVSIQLYVKTGSAWETENEAGFSHFSEHLVFKSTRSFPDNEIMDRITNLGGHINAYTEYDSTCYYLTLPASFLGEAIEVLAELVRFANYDLEDFEAEKKVVIEEFKQYQNDPEDFFLETIAERYFRQNPYRKAIIGNLANLKQSTLEDLRSFYQRHYLPNNCFLVVTGDYQENELWQHLEENFADWQPGELPVCIRHEDEYPEEPRIFSLPKAISNDMLAFVLPDLSDANPDSYAHSLIMKTFAIGKNSRLYKRLFTEEKLIDYLKVHSLSGLNNGIAILLVMPKKKADLNKIIQIFHFELNLLQKFGLTDSEIHETKKEMIYFYRYSYEYVESLGSSLGSEELLTGFENYQKYPKFIRNLRKEHLDEVINKYLQTDKLTIYHLGGRKLKIADLLKTLKESGKSRFTNGLNNDFYQTVLDNGLRIILKKVSGKPTVGLSLTGEVSQLNERESNLGINLLTSGLLLYGNQKRDYNHLLNFCSSNGINCSISPDPETTSVKMKCFQESLPLSLELLSEIISCPQFPSKHLFNLKETYLSNIDRIGDYPQYKAIKLWKEHIFGRFSNLVNIEGNKSTIHRLSRKQVINWFNNYFIPQNMTLALAGDFNFNYTLKNCEKLFSGHSQSTDVLMQEPSFTLPAKKYKKTVQNNDQAIITLGGFGCTALEIEKNTAFHLLAQIIGGDTNSILFRELREKRGLVYSVDFDYFSIRKLGYFMITAIVDKAEKNHTLTIIKDILNDIKTNGIMADDLEKTKNYIKGQRLLEEESMLSRAQTLAILETLGFGYEFYLEREQRLNAVSLKHLHEIAAEYFRDDNYFIHVLA